MDDRIFLGTILAMVAFITGNPITALIIFLIAFL